MSVTTPTGFPGWDVPSVGRRVCGRLLTGVFNLALTVLLFVVLISTGLIAAAVLLLAWIGLGLCLEVGLAATPGQLALGMKQLDAVTGRPAGGRTFLKYLLMGLLGQLTLGIMVLLSIFSMEPPLRRSWFDRMAGVTVGQRSAVPIGASGRAAQPVQQPVEQPSPVSALPLAPEAPPPAWAVVNAPALPQQRLGAASSRLEPASLVEAAETAYRPQPARPASLRILLDDGATLSADRTYVLGRDPAAPDSYPDAVPHRVTDPGMSLSKTHLLVAVDADGLWITDLHSTNGVRVTDASGDTTTAVPGRRTAVPAAGVVIYGRRTLRVES